MTPLEVGLISVVFLFAAILMGIHIGFSLAAISVAGLWCITGDFGVSIKLLGATAYGGVMEYVFASLPMFILMGALSSVSGASKELYDSANILFARVRGGLGITTVIANAIFAAITGASVASAAVFSKVAYPEMRRLGYDRRFALGTVAGSSILGMLIPPSGLMIIYGILTEEAIGRLFMAGVLPGILLSIVYAIGIYLMVLIRPQLGGKRPDIESLNWGSIARMILKPWGVVALVCLVLGGMYLGLFTPTEAGAIGSFGAFSLALIKRKLTPAILWSTLLETGYITASIFLLLITAQMYSQMLTISGLAAKSGEFIASLSLPPIMIILMFVLVFVALGTILDSTSILLVCIPLMIPSVKILGFDMIWFGIVTVVAVEMGLVTPPFGMVVFAMKSVLMDEATIEDIFAGSVPFLIMMAFVLILLMLFPWISTWLPGHM